ncbi:MAG: GTPase HflX, partial [Candidatus Chloroheliales bacterium]
ISDSLDELEQLAATANVDVVGVVTQKLDNPNPATFVGKGKLEEIVALSEQLGVDVVIFDEELSPGQLRNLEAQLNVKVIDRTALILDIFATRAQTREGRLQVELAQMEYRLPRLTRMWTHLARQGSGASGAGVGLRGPGETQLEVDRRDARTRIAHIKHELEDVHAHRELYRQRRKREGSPVVAIVGYTNAGKSTLLNALTAAEVLTEDKLFATLDPTTRQLDLPNGRQALITDTVGFIQRLPTTLVAAFRATLEEIGEADILLHVLDITHPNAQEQAETVNQVLKELGMGDKPRVVALNKIDLLDLPADTSNFSKQITDDLGLPADYIPISAATGIGLDRLRTALAIELDRQLLDLRVTIPYRSSDLVALFHEKGRVLNEEYTDNGTKITGKLPTRYSAQFEPYRN